MHLPFVGSLSLSSSLSDAMEGLRSVLGHDLTARNHYAQPNPRDVFALLRSKVESAGVPPPDHLDRRGGLTTNGMHPILPASLSNRSGPHHSNSNRV